MFCRNSKNITAFYGNNKSGDLMFKWIKKQIDEITDKVTPPDEVVRVSKNLEENVIYLKQQFGSSFDILYKHTTLAGHSAVLVMDDGMCNNILVTQQVVKPILTAEELPEEPEKLLDYIRDNVVAGIDQTDTSDMRDVVTNIVSGLVILLVDGAEYCECFGVQGFPKRGVEDAKTEIEERGAHEAFIESFKDNIALLRRRIRSPVLKCETIEVGSTSQTRVCICYMSDRAKPETVREIKTKLSQAKLDVVLGTGYLRPFLDTDNLSFFSAVGTTERPDVACAEMAEGRIIIIVDGTPFALIAPYLFTENFQTMDDYNYRPFYATFIRLLKYVSFAIAVFLPSIYIAVCTFHQEILPVSMLYDMAVQESMTPFPVVIETIFIHFVYEIVREAGLRMPQAVGHAVSIVGALVIGDAAVTAGLIAAPMLIVVALSAISSFVVSQIYQPVAFLRFGFMIIGGFFGFYGIIIGFAVLLVNMCSVNPFGIPLLSPVAPLSVGAFRDVIFRLGWRHLGRRDLKIQKMEK